MIRPIPFALGLGISTIFSTAQAFADVVHEMPIECPRSTTKEVDHNGTYCAPPQRADCPPGYEPRVNKSMSYCEAPPPAPCARGMRWQSSEPNKGSCVLDGYCDKIGEACDQSSSCESRSFCMEDVDRGRYIQHVGHAACRSQADCKAYPGSKCEKRLSCVDGSNAKHEAARIEAAKNVPASAVPAPYIASFMDGAPPRYPILKDGQKLPPLPDVPEPPDNTPPQPETTPDAGPEAPEDAGFAAPPPNKAADPDAAKPPIGRGGCAGCKVGTSDRDMAGWAALMSLLGVGIALKQRRRVHRSK